MKDIGPWLKERKVLSPPTRGAWIERLLSDIVFTFARSPPTRGAWIESLRRPGSQKKTSRWSPPTRGAWIERTDTCGHRIRPTVAPHTGGVD